MKKYDVVIIGAGTAGLAARKQIANKTDNYLVVDGGELGTTCARVGCMPSKVFIQVANDFHRRKVLSQEGILGAENLTVDHRKVMQHVRSLRDRFVKGVISGLEDWKKTHLQQGYATFTSKNTIEVDGESVSFDKAIIATGSSPVIPEPWRKYDQYLLNTNDFFELEDLPKRIAVIGLGVIGVELGQALHRLGVEVIGINKGNIAGITDPELKEYTSQKFKEEMNIDQTGVEQLNEENGELLIKTKNKIYKVDKALVSIGRTPNIKGLGFESVTDKIDDKGMPRFDEKNFRLKDAPHIFIVGDTNSISPILHESADEGAVAGFLAVNKHHNEFARRIPLGITFSSPNIAFVGKKYSELKDEGISFEVGKSSFEGQGRSIVMLEEKGMLRVYGAKETKQILGAELFAPAGEHLAHLIAWAIASDKAVEEVLSFPFYHPVIEEGLRTALRDLFSKLVNEKKQVELATCDTTLTNKR